MLRAVYINIIETLECITQKWFNTCNILTGLLIYMQDNKYHFKIHSEYMHKKMDLNFEAVVGNFDRFILISVHDHRP